MTIDDFIMPTGINVHGRAGLRTIWLTNVRWSTSPTTRKWRHTLAFILNNVRYGGVAS